MVESIDWLHLFILHYPSFQYIGIFLGTLLGGELALLAFGFLVAQGILPIFPGIVLSFFGAFSPNILWFLLGKSATVDVAISHRYANTTLSIIHEAVSRASRGSHLVALIIIKFLVGTPFTLIMYANKTKLDFKNFIYYESVAIFLSLCVMVSIGFVSGLGFTYLADLFKNLYAALGFVLLIIIIVIIGQILFEKKFIKKI